MFLHGSATPQASWTVIGIGIRMAQDVGAHRKKTYTTRRTVDEELWKRAFWQVSNRYLCDCRSCWDCRCLLAYDRFVSSALGRPCAIHDEE